MSTSSPNPQARDLLAVTCRLASRHRTVTMVKHRRPNADLSVRYLGGVDADCHCHSALCRSQSGRGAGDCPMVGFLNSASSSFARCLVIPSLLVWPLVAMSHEQDCHIDITLQGRVLGNTFKGHGGPALSSAGQIHRADMRLVSPFAAASPIRITSRSPQMKTHIWPFIKKP